MIVPAYPADCIPDNCFRIDRLDDYLLYRYRSRRHRDHILVTVLPQVGKWNNLVLVTEKGHLQVFGCLCFSDLDKKLAVNVCNGGNIGFLYGN